MLEFIVLGQIPGTSIQITFTQLVRVGLLLVATLLVLVELHVYRAQTAAKLKLSLQDIINRLAL